MVHVGSSNSRSVLWTGKPWILPGVLARSILIVVAAVVVFWLEFLFGVAYETIASLFASVQALLSVPIISSLPIILWTVLAFFLIWAFSIVHLLLLRASNTYILHDDSLEIRTGILNSRAFVVSPSGFSDLEVFRSIIGRIMNSGDMIIHTQSETDSIRKLVRVRNPLKVADQIREVVARPIVRIDGPEPKEEKK
jgi:uncharacterized membrane protein YdbT with pleckstrin-like domain